MTQKSQDVIAHRVWSVFGVDAALAEQPENSGSKFTNEQLGGYLIRT